MITPLDIENKKFSKRALNGYSTEEVDDFLDELTIDYEKIYKESTEAKQKIESLNSEVEKYRQMETTLQSTLLMAQNAAEEIKNSARLEADKVLSNAQNSASAQLSNIDASIMAKQKELQDLKDQIATYKAKMESLLVSQLELLKNS